MIRKISRYRDPIMGLAILWIMLHHSGMNLPGKIFLLKRAGYGGVDLFLFLSGMGMYYSLSKNPDVLSFYRRRILRIYPHYIPILIVFLAMNAQGAGIASQIRDLLGNATGITYWAQVGHRFNWYIPFILTLYLLTPILFEYLTAKKLRGGVLLLILALAAGFCYVPNQEMMTSVSRLPIYVVGMMSGQVLVEKRERKKDQRKQCAAMLAGGVIGLAWLIIVYQFSDRLPQTLNNVFYPFLLIAPALLALLCLIFEALEKSGAGKRIVSAFGALGKISLDVYLIHIVSFSRLGRLIEHVYDNKSAHPFSAKNFLLWCLVSALVIAVSYAYSKIIDLLTDRMIANR